MSGQVTIANLCTELGVPIGRMTAILEHLSGEPNWPSPSYVVPWKLAEIDVPFGARRYDTQVLTAEIAERVRTQQAALWQEHFDRIVDGW